MIEYQSSPTRYQGAMSFSSGNGDSNTATSNNIHFQKSAGAMAKAAAEYLQMKRPSKAHGLDAYNSYSHGNYNVPVPHHSAQQADVIESIVNDTFNDGADDGDDDPLKCSSKTTPIASGTTLVPSSFKMLSKGISGSGLGYSHTPKSKMQKKASLGAGGLGGTAIKK